MNPTVSIVLPCYNGAGFLAQSIDSVISQTYTGWELILVNDCSKDNSLDIMQDYAAHDSRILIINNEHNLKLPGALNRGFREANGKYLTWTSHDNRMGPTMLEEFVNYLDANPDKGLVTACYAAFSLKTGEQLYEVHHPDPQLHLPLFNCVCYAFMYRREVLETVGDYDTTLFLVEDYDYWVRIWLKYPIGKIYKVHRPSGFRSLHLRSAPAHGYWQVVHTTAHSHMILPLSIGRTLPRCATSSISA
ncbi:MAG: glycosyltransferase [Elusimicrobiaceae bacterium]|nr:glycosyltransferase [Elusimicrobiaceae bacterium]